MGPLYNKTYDRETWVGHGHYHQPINDIFLQPVWTQKPIPFFSSVNLNDLTKKFKCFIHQLLWDKEKPTIQSQCIVVIVYMWYYYLLVR